MKIQGIGLPFSYHQSSCSCRKPKNFEWTEEESDIEVWVDMAIPSAIGVPKPDGKKRYAWICESRAIVPLLRKAFEQEDLFNDIVDSYDAIFTCEKELVDKHEKIHFCFVGSNLPWTKEENYGIYDKQHFVSTSFCSSSKKLCEGHMLRHDLLEEIRYSLIRAGTQKINTFGNIVGNPVGSVEISLPGRFPLESSDWHDKSEFLYKYMFSVIMENDKYDTYFTEKITDCFATGTIPLYYGTKDIGKYFNTDGIIMLHGTPKQMQSTIDQVSVSMYEQRIDAIKDNLERVKNLQMADDMLFDKIQELNS